jgi:hypothetical protein
MALLSALLATGLGKRFAELASNFLALVLDANLASKLAPRLRTRNIMSM